MQETQETDQQFEKDWWGTCANTFGEEAKQLTYAHRMGFGVVPDGGRWPAYDMGGRSVVDLGGGPVSILLKCFNLGEAVVVDPCPYPEWVTERYEAAGIRHSRSPAETYLTYERNKIYDEVWIYNVLQHVLEPDHVVATATRLGKTLRIFEWLETETNVGHPHTLHADELNRWVGGTGTVEQINENGAVGLCYYGVFDLAV